MNNRSRTHNVFLNIAGGVGAQIFTSILSFVCRTVFIKLLSQSYLGVNGLFSTILSMLSLAELGIGPAIVFSMYKPIADNDEVHVAKLMNFYKTAYRVIGLAVAAIGISLTPFLGFFIKDPGDVENLRLIFLLTVAGTALSYVMVYKGAMLNADQKSYVCIIIKNIFAVIQNIAQIIVLILTHNYILYLIVNICTVLLTNFVQMIYVDRKYPFLVTYKNERIDKTEQRDIFKRVRGMMMHKIGGFVLNSTDNLIISNFVGLISVGIYSNYNMIITLIKTYVNTVLSSLSASVGNLIAKESNEKSYEVFRVTMFIHFMIYAFCFNCLWCVFQTLIKWWIGESYLLSLSTLFIVLLNFYCCGMQEAINTFTNATGFFWETRFKPVAECIINIGVSVFLAYKLGITGVFIGTFASYICTFWINPLIMYKKQFCVKPRKYFVKYAIYLLLTLFIAFCSQFICDALIKENTLLGIFIRLSLCISVYGIVIFVLFCKTKEFQYCTDCIKRILRKLKDKKQIA